MPTIDVSDLSAIEVTANCTLTAADGNTFPAVAGSRYCVSDKWEGVLIVGDNTPIIGMLGTARRTLDNAQAFPPAMIPDVVRVPA